jgi:glycosyltransferase involved in cell wall biosynthesis
VGRARVLHLIDSAGVYGAERVILNLAQEHIEGGEVTPVVGCLIPHADAPSALHDTAMQEGIESLRLPVANQRLPFDLLRLMRVLRRERIDLVHAHGYKPAVFAFVARLLAGIPAISTCHLWFEPEHGPLKKRLMVAVEKRLYRWFPRVLAVSEDIRGILVTEGVPADRVTVVPNGVATHAPALTAAERERIRASLGVAPGEFCVLNAGRLARQKCQSLLVDAAARLKALGRPCKVLIVGDGELEGQLQQQIQSLGVQDHVRLLGFREDVPELLAASDAFALPSLGEGMPMSLLEAVAARVPVIATAVGDVGKLVVDGRSGIIIQPGDVDGLVTAIDSLRAQPQLALAITGHAHQLLIDGFSQEAMAASYLAVYREVLHAGSPAPLAARR